MYNLNSCPENEYNFDMKQNKNLSWWEKIKIKFLILSALLNISSFSC